MSKFLRELDERQRNLESKCDRQLHDNNKLEKKQDNDLVSGKLAAS
jgi:hypothetical protein